MSKEEDLLTNIALKLMEVIKTNVKSDKLDLDIMTDITMLLWKKCKDVLQNYQNGINIYNVILFCLLSHITKIIHGRILKLCDFIFYTRL